MTLLRNDKSNYKLSALTHVHKEVWVKMKFGWMALWLRYEDMRSYSPPLLYESDLSFCPINNR